MKKQSLRSRSGSTTPIPVRHQFDHEVPTVIHHPEEKMTALARLTHRVILDPGKYATWALGIRGRRARDRRRIELDLVGPIQDFRSLDQARLRRPSPKTWPRPPRNIPVRTLRNGPCCVRRTNITTTAMADLPNNRDVAVSNLKRALDSYEQVAKEAPKDSFQARAAFSARPDAWKRGTSSPRRSSNTSWWPRTGRIRPRPSKPSCSPRHSRSRRPSHSTKSSTRIPHRRSRCRRSATKSSTSPAEEARRQARHEQFRETDPRAAGGNDSSRHQRNQAPPQARSLPSNVFTPEKKAETENPEKPAIAAHPRGQVSANSEDRLQPDSK